MIKSDRCVSSAVSMAKAAYSAGALKGYSALDVSGTEGVAATAAASWGPLMRR